MTGADKILEARTLIGQAIRELAEMMRIARDIADFHRLSQVRERVTAAAEALGLQLDGTFDPANLTQWDA